MPISKKQRQIMAFQYTGKDALICDGSIRSGKTVFMMLSFVDWAMRCYNHQRFAICGKTVDSAVKNIVGPYIVLGYAKQKYSLKWRRADKVLIVSRGNVQNTFEIIGGKDESSFTLIQGRTLAGVLLDEVALQPRSFVDQALARCSVEGSKLWFNCNPGSPQHWFYLEWVTQPERHNAIRLHFHLEDNPSLGQKIIDRYKSMYSGVFYRRYIDGEWCVAEGLVYPMFSPEKNVVSEIPDEFIKFGAWYVSIDYGTLNPFSAGLWCIYKGRAIRVNEYYYSGRDTEHLLTDDEYYSALKALIGDHDIQHIVIDPSAASMIATIRRHGEYSVRKARNEVMEGISTTATMLKNGIIKIHERCTDAIREFGLYCWDEDSTEDRVIKDNDHAMDEIRYLAMTVLKRNSETKEILEGL